MAKGKFFLDNHGCAKNQVDGEEIAARLEASGWAWAEGAEDADTLFFERRLVMEGDTEFGLLLKNTLDAIGPLVPTILARSP